MAGRVPPEPEQPSARLGGWGSANFLELECTPGVLPEFRLFLADLSPGRQPAELALSPRPAWTVIIMERADDHFCRKARPMATGTLAASASRLAARVASEAKRRGRLGRGATSVSVNACPQALQMPQAAFVSIILPGYPPSLGPKLLLHCGSSPEAYTQD